MKNQYQHAGYPADPNIQFCNASKRFAIVPYFKCLLPSYYHFPYPFLKNENVERLSETSASVSFVSGVFNLLPDLSVIGLKMVKI
ncbi:hypothetical protein HRH25_19190 [Flavisolibacter sp. BT320]|nr:hypothetical protein [Flavisolibacter longurius]